MKHGFISVACGTPKLRLADCHFNAEQTFTMMREAENRGVKVLVLPELGLTGYTCGDLWNLGGLIAGAEEALATVLAATRPLEVVTAIGMPVEKDNKLYNCAVIIQKGIILGVVPKTVLPNYDGMAESRWFAPAPEENASVTLCGQTVPFGKLVFACDSVRDLKLGFEIGEDMKAPVSPSASLAAAGATIIGCLAASPEIGGKDASRRQSITMQSAKLLCGYLYAGADEGESTSDVVYGAAQFIAENGELLVQSRFEGGMHVSEIDVEKLNYERRRTQAFTAVPWDVETVPFSLTVTETKLTRYIAPSAFVPEDKADRDAQCQEMLFIASLGLKQRMAHTGARTAVIGLSGGLDSTLAVLITGLAMKMLDRPASDIIAVTMPCFGTTDRTKNNAVILAEQMGATLRTVNIANSVRSHFKDIGHDINDHSVTFENGQARERTQVLMDIANQTGGIVIGTGDLSELALGWCTYNGDQMSMYGVNGTIPKTLVRHLVGYMAKDNLGKDEALHDVLEDILDTPVSPELLPAVQGQIAQKTEDLVGPYELHDFFLYYILRWGFSPAKVYRLAVKAQGDVYSREVILKWLKTFYRRFFAQQFKRSCMPDGVSVSEISLSPRGSWRMPSDAKWALWQAELEKLG